MLFNQIKNQHLMWRAGFGPAAGQLTELKNTSPAELYKALQNESSAKPAYIDVADSYLKDLMEMDRGEKIQRKKELDEEDRKMIRRKQRDGIKDLNLHWFNQMIDSKAQLQEKMAFFWHGHFASRNVNVIFQQQLLDVIRQNALGNFRDLLHGVSKSAAMLNFLNAQQNKKDHPNENFAREVMELFTMGRGHYSEKDIKEAARAFTGWGYNAKGDFQIRRFQHDEGTKTVLGKNGNLSGEEVLNILVDQKDTAKFIATKVYRFFVNQKADFQKIDWLADRFYKSDYNIGKLMEDIFTSDWFYDEKNIGAQIKSPVELLSGIQRMLPMELKNEESMLLIQRILGQVLFYPPNVAGWPGGKNWIDSSSLMMRLRIPKLINDNDELNVRPKTDDDVMGGRTEEGEPNIAKPKRGYGKVGKPINAAIQWTRYTKNFETVPRENLVPALQSALLQVKTGFNADVIKNNSDNSARDIFIKTATIQIMSTPEYQMC
jgi:uncharacterized protein (DUF1800 family)